MTFICQYLIHTRKMYKWYFPLMPKGETSISHVLVNNKIIEGKEKVVTMSPRKRTYCETRSVQGLVWLKKKSKKKRKRNTDGLKHNSSLFACLKEREKPVNTMGKCHQMSETELLQTKEEQFLRDNVFCGNLLKLYKSNAWKLEASIGKNVNNNQSNRSSK